MHLRIISYIFPCIQRSFFFFIRTRGKRGMKDRVAFIRSIHWQHRNSSLSVEGNHCQRRKISVTVSLVVLRSEPIKRAKPFRAIRWYVLSVNVPFVLQLNHEWIICVKVRRIPDLPFCLPRIRTSRKRWIYGYKFSTFCMLVSYIGIGRWRTIIQTLCLIYFFFFVFFISIDSLNSILWFEITMFLKL